jgi:AcrR family transcriptional regulator
MPKVSESHRELRRRQILDGARRAFSAHGYFGTNVAMLEDAIGLSRGAIFNYYGSKLDLFVALYEEDRRRLVELWIEHGFEALVRHIGEDDPEWLGIYLEVGRMLRTDDALRERWRELAVETQAPVFEWYRVLRETREIRDDVPLEQLLRFIGLIVDGLVLQRGARFPVDVDGTLELVRELLAPK